MNIGRGIGRPRGKLSPETARVPKFGGRVNSNLRRKAGDIDERRSELGYNPKCAIARAGQDQAGNGEPD